ncbi:alpha/beta fold hydrolase [Pontixanthobacter sp.]|uniref:alpha/beta fold hydrolase n=1 Tax=Pontixanthobacter sp. TaxID=2792078 RepID=UPI003C7A8F52
MPEIEFHESASGRHIAYRFQPGSGPALVFLPGYMSDMDGGKATAIMEWAARNGRACLLLDYSGCGRSDGDFADGSLSLWRDETCGLIDALPISDIVLIGSSMGGWLMLLIGEMLGHRLGAMIGIAAAPDFSDWGFNAAQKAALAAGQTVYEDNPYGPEPTPTHAKFWQDAETLKRLDSVINITCPVHLLHGQNDTDVPWNTSLKLAAALRSAAVQVHLVKDGDHRLSRDQDIALLIWLLENLHHAPPDRNNA